MQDVSFSGELDVEIDYSLYPPPPLSLSSSTSLHVRSPLVLVPLITNEEQKLLFLSRALLRRLKEGWKRSHDAVRNFLCFCRVVSLHVISRNGSIEPLTILVESRIYLCLSVARLDVM